jgi:hypothetical protein
MERASPRVHGRASSGIRARRDGLPQFLAVVEDMDMKQETRISAARVNLSRDEDGRQAARLVALSMGLLFSLIFLLQAISW